MGNELVDEMVEIIDLVDRNALESVQTILARTLVGGNHHILLRQRSALRVQTKFDKILQTWRKN